MFCAENNLDQPPHAQDVLWLLPVGILRYQHSCSLQSMLTASLLMNLYNGYSTVLGQVQSFKILRIGVKPEIFVWAFFHQTMIGSSLGISG